jgi:hypothetical protein
MVFAERLQKGLIALVTVIMMERRASVSIFWYKFVYAMCFDLNVYGSLSRKLYN